MKTAPLKVAFDLSEIEFDAAGSGVYARCLSQHLATMADHLEVEAVSVADHVPRWLPGPLKVLFCDLVWTPWLLARRTRQSGAHLLHCPTYKAPPRCRVPVVATCHDASLVDDSPPPSFGLWSRLQGRRHLALLRSRAVLVLTCSEYSKARMVARLGLPGEKIRVIPLGLREVFSEPAGPDEGVRVRRAHGLEGPYILFVGTIERRKNVDGLVRAFHALRRDKSISHRLVLAGRPGSGAAETRQLVERLGLRDAVDFLGYVPDRDLPGLYREASLFVYLSLYEGFGLPPLEAMSQRTLTVVSNRTSLPEVVGDGAMLVDPVDEEKVISIMYRGLTDSGLRRDLIGRASARTRLFRWEDTARGTLHAYRLALEGTLPR